MCKPGCCPNTCCLACTGVLSYVDAAISTPGDPLIQVIIARMEHMHDVQHVREAHMFLGLECYAEWHDSRYSPGIVEPVLVTWSLDLESPDGVAIALMVLTSLLLLSNVGLGIWAEPHAKKSCLGLNTSIFKRATLVLPFGSFFLIHHSSLAVSKIALYRAVVLVLCSARVFRESGELGVPQLQIVVLPVVRAMPMLGTFAIVIGFVALLLAEVYGELFGVFEDVGLLTDGIANVVKILTSPPHLAHENMDQSLAGALGSYAPPPSVGHRHSIALG